MKTRLLTVSLLGWIAAAASASASTWNYVAHYPWTYSFTDGWFYQYPVQKVWQGGAWVPSPLGEPFDIAEVFDAPLASLGGTDGEGRYFRLTISEAYPHLGLLALGGKTRQRVDPVVAEVADGEVIDFLDPVALPDRPYPEHEGHFDALYLVQLRAVPDDILGRAVIYFESLKPFLSWADRGAVRGMVQFRFRALGGGQFTLIGSLDGDRPIEGIRGAFRAVVYEVPAPPDETPVIP